MISGSRPSASRSAASRGQGRRNRTRGPHNTDPLVRSTKVDPVIRMSAGREARPLSCQLRLRARLPDVLPRHAERLDGREAASGKVGAYNAVAHRVDGSVDGRRELTKLVDPLPFRAGSPTIGATLARYSWVRTPDQPRTFKGSG